MMYQVKVYYKLSAMQPGMMRETECEGMMMKDGLLKLYDRQGNAEVFRMYMVDKVEVRHVD